MKFLDEAKIYIKAGDGGNGCLSFRREKFIEFGGPDGGNGGKGGSIYAVGVKNVNTLIDYRYQQHFKAKKGENGKGQNKTGRSSEDIFLKVPVGTQILDADKITEIADITEEGQTILLIEGGNGGLGNFHFKSSTNQAPRRTTNGHLGEEKWIWLKLKLIADIGLIGLPNAGKSSFIKAVTNTNAKVGEYPFTTLSPQLGIARVHDSELVVADIPGIIEDAHSGKGLGDRFLAHIERCSILLHIIDISSDNPVKNYEIIRKELIFYSESMPRKPEIIVLNKSDLSDNDEIHKTVLELKNYTKNEIFALSAFNREDCRKVIEYASQFVKCKDDKW
ncbi:MAG: GTPase ObgE [Holosporales bacterium]|jgi:GTP-binding protein|nr:GTPase ObgE [Holosporales bacterium]